jgi:hypothetical protein
MVSIVLIPVLQDGGKRCGYMLDTRRMGRKELGNVKEGKRRKEEGRSNHEKERRRKKCP